MTIITGITSQPKQQMTLQVPNQTQATLFLEYKPQQKGWFFSLTWGTITLNGCRLTAFPNLLRQWRRLLPFGLMVVAANNVEPTTVTALSDGSTTLLILDPADVAAVEAASFPGS